MWKNIKKNVFQKVAKPHFPSWVDQSLISVQWEMTFF